jgi:hypothetical protein
VDGRTVDVVAVPGFSDVVGPPVEPVVAGGSVDVAPESGVVSAVVEAGAVLDVVSEARADVPPPSPPLPKSRKRPRLAPASTTLNRTAVVTVWRSGDMWRDSTGG